MMFVICRLVVLYKERELVGFKYLSDSNTMYWLSRDDFQKSSKIFNMTNLSDSSVRKTCASRRCLRLFQTQGLHSLTVRLGLRGCENCYIDVLAFYSFAAGGSCESIIAHSLKKGFMKI